MKEILKNTIIYSWAEEERHTTLTYSSVLMIPDILVFKDHMTGEAIHQYSTRGLYFKVMSDQGEKKNQFFMWFSKAFLLPDNYFIYFFYSGKSEYPIFLCTAKVKHRNERDTVNIYAQFICIWLLWNKAYVAISR